MPVTFTVNTRAFTSDAPPQTPLLWVIREQLKLTGTKFGCGAGLCGACMVHIDGKRALFLSDPIVRGRGPRGDDDRRPVDRFLASCAESLASPSVFLNAAIASQARS